MRARALEVQKPSLRSLLLCPVAEHVGSDARAIDASLSLLAHQLVEHLNWQDSLKTICANNWSTNFARWWLLLVRFEVSARHAFNQYQQSVSVSR